MKVQMQVKNEGYAVVEINSKGEEQVFADDFTMQQVSAMRFQENHYELVSKSVIVSPLLSLRPESNGIEKEGMPDDKF